MADIEGEEPHMQPTNMHEMFVERSADGRFRIFAKHPNRPVVYDITRELQQQFAEPH